MLNAGRFAVLFVLFALLAVNVTAQKVSQPTIWASKPDVAAFEKIENDHLSAARASVTVLVAAKGARTIENTLVPFDEAIRQINTAAY